LAFVPVVFEALELFHLHLDAAEFFAHGGVLVLEAKLKPLIGALLTDPNLQTDILPARIIKGQVRSDLCSLGKIFASVKIQP
jgi:hypothetical protein